MSGRGHPFLFFILNMGEFLSIFVTLCATMKIL